ncbi:hypothetical protein MGYG_07184 [Nannizzia gypsea CBS 118893]|uniref:AMP-dependent synthetase/ligase domain-containing protein n=1 Tax=Arthroderma gypseum (strain ATCC MYA-4604 / CBS 118893) TaxID=535722 RepID=E4V2B2_ARTGP|nr:hypothetical protein MGYG_07184 [Nannizzia gypsea CBS 118893]EFR04177.1 hypothetical protein MGYG_07184 [Nannizzia gypsea CBS 118893]
MAEKVARIYCGCDIEKTLNTKTFVKHIIVKNSKGDKAYWKSALAVSGLPHRKARYRDQGAGGSPVLRKIRLDACGELIVASRKNKQMAEVPGTTKRLWLWFTSGGQALNLSAIAKTRLLPSTDPSETLMVLFTSGSTGLPKGTIITHSLFATAINHHRKVFGIGPGERVYDFTSYSFDIAWFNALQSLSHGACLCIPSEQERKTTSKDQY